MRSQTEGVVFFLFQVDPVGDEVFVENVAAWLLPELFPNAFSNRAAFLQAYRDAPYSTELRSTDFMN